MAGAHPVIGTLAMANTEFLNAAMSTPTQVTLTAADSPTDATLIVAENVNRHLGVLVQHTDNTAASSSRIGDAIGFTKANGFRLQQFLGVNSAPRQIFFYGTGPLYGRSNGGATTTVAYTEI